MVRQPPRWAERVGQSRRDRRAQSVVVASAAARAAWSHARGVLRQAFGQLAAGEGGGSGAPEGDAPVRDRHDHAVCDGDAVWLAAPLLDRDRLSRGGGEAAAPATPGTESSTRLE